jgi:hypothetical protein
MLRQVRKPVKLRPHDLAVADVPVQDALIQDAPKLRSFQHRLPLQPRGYLHVQVVLVATGPHGKNRPRVILGLQQSRHDERLR